MRLLLLSLTLLSCARPGSGPVDSGSSPAAAVPASPFASCPSDLKPTGDLDAAEARLLAGEPEVKLDPVGCRVLRRRDAGVEVFSEELEITRGGSAQPPRSHVVYVREISGRMTRDFFDTNLDGIFEDELVHESDDAGWLADESTRRDDAGTHRIRTERVGKHQKREIRQAWIDGGWETLSDTVGPRKTPLRYIKQ